MLQADIILDTLERAGEACADPAPLIYRRLFEMHPELEKLFLMDPDGGVRGSMLQTCLSSILGLLDGERTPRFIIAASRMDHASYGVPDDKFDIIFAAIRDTFRDLIGPDWTPAMDRAWSGLLAEIATIQ